jgi:hypothetical protein
VKKIKRYRDMKTKFIKLEMIERILNYLDINNKLRIPANERDRSPNLYLFDEPLIPFIVRSIYFTEDVLNLDIRSNEDFYNTMNGTLSDTIRISYKDECYGLESDLNYLLSIKGLRSLEGILYTNHIRYSKKELSNKK